MLNTLSLRRLWRMRWTAAPNASHRKQLGNAARTNRCRVANQYNMDLALRKSIQLTEKTRIAVRFEAINLTNTAKFRAPEYRVGRGSFGTIIEQAGFPRLVQYMIRYEF